MRRGSKAARKEVARLLSLPPDRQAEDLIEALEREPVIEI